MGTVEHPDAPNAAPRWLRLSLDRPATAPDFLAPTVVVAVLIAVAAWIGRRLWFFSDDWNIFTDYTSGNLTVPFNGHLSAVPVGIYQGLFHTVGMGSYWPYRIVGLVGLAVLGFQVTRWCGVRLSPLAATVAVGAIMWNSAGTTNVLFPFLINFSLPIAALVALWWHLDRLGDWNLARERGLEIPAGSCVAHEIAVGFWLALALATSGLGVMAAVAVLVELLLRRAPWRTWLAWFLPVCVWLVWWVGHRESNDVSTDVSQVVPYFLRMLWGGPTSITAGNKALGAVLGILLAAWVVAASLRARRLDPRVGGAMAAAVAFAGLTALTRQGTFPPIVPDEPRYAWTIGAYLVLAAVAQATVSKATVPTPSSTTSPDDSPNTEASPAAAPSWYGPTLAACAGLTVVVLLVGAFSLTDAMDEWTDSVAGAAPGLRSNLYAAEAVGTKQMSQDAIIGPLSFLPVSARAYLGAVDEVGSPLSGATPGEIGGRPDQLTAAEQLFFDNVVIPRPEQAVASFRPGLPGCSAAMEALPGTSVLVVRPTTEAQPGGASILLSRFVDGDGSEGAGGTGVSDEPGQGPRMDVPLGASTLTLPRDAGVATDVAVPYQLFGEDGALFCQR